MLVFESYLINDHITAILPAKNLSRPLLQPHIFTSVQLFKTATFKESGRGDSHLATIGLMPFLEWICIGEDIQ
jgi:hypothetical protein